jgi:diguanylate cyclase (GGDEF)-like protein
MDEQWSKLSSEDFENLSILRLVAPEAVQGILGSCEIRTVEPGDLLIEAGMMTGELYLILEGELSVRVVDGQKSDAIFLDVGQTVGELSVIDHRPTSAEVRAEQYTRVLVVHEDMFWRLIDVSHQFAKNMLILLSQRMRSDNELLQENIVMKNMFEEQTTLDPMTGLHNRRWLDINLPKIMRRSSFGGESLSILMLDIDHFKQVNDTYGHLKGDVVLRLVSDVLRDSIRPGDFACRYGGEEFIVIFPRTTAENAEVPAERIRRQVEKRSILAQDDFETPAVTISGGLAELGAQFRDQTDDSYMAGFIRVADEKLYQAKESGRNRIL